MGKLMVEVSLTASGVYEFDDLTSGWSSQEKADALLGKPEAMAALRASAHHAVTTAADDSEVEVQFDE